MCSSIGQAILCGYDEATVASGVPPTQKKKKKKKLCGVFEGKHLRPKGW